MVENRRGVQYGGGFRYGWQPGMTDEPDELTVLRYTNPAAAKRYARLMRFGRIGLTAIKRRAGSVSPNPAKGGT